MFEVGQTLEQVVQGYCGAFIFECNYQPAERSLECPAVTDPAPVRWTKQSAELPSCLGHSVSL